ncbi:ABC transporter permease [Prosthecomicrobium hirschii]|uniref:Taurine ABC transporter permease n=1 Tax=Prosthecodimorpha hirschii TaxID=665126 RepID=A0A0N8GE87_9HYPH|nr:ABC transporter permease [Prosthecomicrobium hirschii]KPL50833.1 taurine ABC transporter permease [Prosthecomicrobium hirschii]MCW1839409.1 ABC transporter permease [Prosthecomicrobium hirschii]
METFDARRLLPIIGPILFFAVWYLAVAYGLVNKVLFPSPFETVAHLFTSFGKGGMQVDVASTFLRTGTAFVIAAAIGVPIGVALGASESAYRSVEFLIDFFRSTPSSALIPLFLLIFGITDANKIAIASFAAFLVILFNSAYGVMNARKTRILAARVMGSNSWQIFKDVLIWESLSQTFVGLRTGVSIALVIVIVAEMFIGSETGLGHRIIDAQQVLNVKDMYASILITGALGYLLNLAFLLLEKRFIHWSGK